MANPAPPRTDFHRICEFLQLSDDVGRDCCTFLRCVLTPLSSASSPSLAVSGQTKRSTSTHQRPICRLRSRCNPVLLLLAELFDTFRLPLIDRLCSPASQNERRRLCALGPPQREHNSRVCVLCDSGLPGDRGYVTTLQWGAWWETPLKTEGGVPVRGSWLRPGPCFKSSRTSDRGIKTPKKPKINKTIIIVSIFPGTYLFRGRFWNRLISPPTFYIAWDFPRSRGLSSR